MTDAAVSVRPRESTTETDDLNHLWCCHDRDTSLCGLDITDAPEVDDEEIDCIVCLDLDEFDICPNGLVCPYYTPGEYN